MPPVRGQGTCDFGDGTIYQDGDQLGSEFTSRCGSAEEFPCFCNTALDRLVECPYCAVATQGGGLACARDGDIFTVINISGDQQDCTCSVNLPDGSGEATCIDSSSNTGSGGGTCVLATPSGDVVFQDGESYGDYLPNRCGPEFPCFCNPSVQGNIECPFCAFVNNVNDLACAHAGNDVTFINTNDQYVLCTCLDDLDSVCVPTPDPTPNPTTNPTPNPTANPTPSPTPEPTANPTTSPPTLSPTAESAPPTSGPTPQPTIPTTPPTMSPVQPGTTPSPSMVTESPTPNPTPFPTVRPTPSPTVRPTPSPTVRPTPSPTGIPTSSPTVIPTPMPSPVPITPMPVVISTNSPSKNNNPNGPTPTMPTNDDDNASVRGCLFANSNDNTVVEDVQKGESFGPHVRGPCSPWQDWPVLCNPDLAGNREYPYCVFSANGMTMMTTTTTTTTTRQSGTATTDVICARPGERAIVPSSDGNFEECSCLYVNAVIGAVSSCPMVPVQYVNTPLITASPTDGPTIATPSPTLRATQSDNVDRSESSPPTLRFFHRHHHRQQQYAVIYTTTIVFYFGIFMLAWLPVA